MIILMIIVLTTMYCFLLQDVAIGAPFEDNDSGAVYIYHGSASGVKAQYAQVGWSSMHGQHLEFGNLIPGTFCFWREIFAILRGNLSFGWIWSFLTNISENL